MCHETSSLASKNNRLKKCSTSIAISVGRRSRRLPVKHPFTGNWRIGRQTGDITYSTQNAVRAEKEIKKPKQDSRPSSAAGSMMMRSVCSPVLKVRSLGLAFGYLTSQGCHLPRSPCPLRGHANVDARTNPRATVRKDAPWQTEKSIDAVPSKDSFDFCGMNDEGMEIGVADGSRNSVSFAFLGVSISHIVRIYGML